MRNLNNKRRIPCSATVEFSTYRPSSQGQAIPVINISLAMPTDDLSGEARPILEPIECEGELALAIWNHLIKSNDVTIS